MLVKFVLLLFCCALINAKTLVRRDPRHVAFAGEEIQGERLPASLKGIFHRERIEENIRLGTSPLVQTEQDNNDEEDDDLDEESDEETKINEEEVKNKDKTEDEEDAKDDDDDEDDDDDDNQNTESEKNEDENKESKKDEGNEDEQEQEDDDADETEEETPADQKQENVNNNEKKEEEDEISEELSESTEEVSNSQTSDKKSPNAQSSYASVGMERNPEESFKFPKDQINTFPASQNSKNDRPSATDNFFNLQTLAKNLPPLEKFLPEYKPTQTKNDSPKKLSDDLLLQQIAEFESEPQTENEDIENDHQSSNIHFDLDHDSVKTFISDSIPKSIGNIQNNLQGFGEMWQKIPKDFGSLQTKLQGLKDTWMNTVNQNFQPIVRNEPKVGFGGWDKQQKAMFGNITKYVNKAVEQAQDKLEENGRTIEANNPALTINLIPGTPVTFQLKRVEGAHTIDQHGQSRAIRYNKLYAFAQCKFTELRYYYDIIVKPMNLFGIRKSITVVLSDAPARMSLSIENKDEKNAKSTNGKITVMGLEFVNPDVTVETGTNRFSDYALNYLVNDISPIVKQKLVEIVSRDSKLILVDYLKDSQ